MKLIKSGVYSSKDLEKILGDRMAISRAVGRGELNRIAQGLYATPDLVDDRKVSILTAAKLYPKAVVSRSSALSHHDLYDFPGDEFHLDLKEDSGRIENKGFVAFHRSKNIKGIESASFDGVKLSVYVPERAVFEALHIEPGVGRVANEVVIKYMKRFNKDGKGVERLMEFAPLFGSRGQKIVEIAMSLQQAGEIY